MSSIFEFAKNGDFDGVKNLIENGTDVNTQNKDGETPLHKACEKDHLDIVKFLIENGADVNIKNEKGRAPLHIASYESHLDIVKLLIENGADVNIEDSNGNNPLRSHYCHFDVNLDIVKIFIENGLDINNYKNITGDQKHIDTVIQSLIKNNPNNKYEIIKKLNETTAFEFARYGYFDDVKNLIIKNDIVDINRKDERWRKNQNTLLHNASYFGHLDIVKLLIENGANVNIKNIDGETPLHTACWNGHLDTVKFLIENDADINIRTDENPLSQDPMFIENYSGIDYDSDDSDDSYSNNVNYNGGNTPLHIACKTNNLYIVKFLIENWAEINITDSDGNTPFYIACYENYLDIVKFFIVNCVGEKKKPLDYIISFNKKNFNIIKFFIENNPNNKDEIIKLFLDNPLSSEFTEKLLAI
jgi:ankyrin repeat protein